MKENKFYNVWAILTNRDDSILGPNFDDEKVLGEKLTKATAYETESGTTILPAELSKFHSRIYEGKTVADLLEEGKIEMRVMDDEIEHYADREYITKDFYLMHEGDRVK